ncbi:MAG: TonB-dependent receptor [Blastocatellia bacterium]|nr:TonB-dependent receptor [Blastocatellia bacterium]
MIRRFAPFAAVFAMVVISVFSIAAQDLDDVTISGRLTDSNGLAVVGATVTATETATGTERSVVTDDDGRYRFLKLKPGSYKIKAAATGFGIQETPVFTTISADNAVRDFKLSPADVKAEQVVTVTDDDAPLVDTTRTIVGSSITEREIEEIPNSGRNALDLVLTLGGTAEEQLSTRDLAEDRGQRGLSAPGTTPEESGIFGISGGAAYSNNITIDGLDNNDDRGASFRFQPSLESISEVQVINNQFSAEYGRASGGRINLRTRGGSNRFRGRAFYFFRDDNLNANTWNNNRNGIARPPLRNHNPGFTFGGPIVKNKLFFFTSYEYDNIADTTVLDAWVPLGFQNPAFPLPAPTNPNETFNITQTVNGQPQTVTVARYIVPTDTPAKKHLFTGRGDWTINNAQNLTVSYQLGRSNDLRAFSGTNRIADSLIGRVRNTDAINATHNWVISPSVVNQARFQYSTLKPSSAQDAGAATSAVLVTFTGPTGQGGTQVFGSSTNSSDRTETRWQFQDSMSVLKGPHTFRFGVDYQHIDAVYTDRFDATGTYTFGNFYFFSINSPSRYQQNFNTTSEVKNNYVGVFFQHDWRVKSNFSLNLGLRYERESVLADNNNFGPRVAFAWNPFKKSDKTVIRFGAGIFYNRVLLRTIDDYTADSGSLRLDTNSLNVPTGVTVDLAVVRAYLGTQFPNGLTANSVIPVNATNSYTAAQLSRSSTAFRSLSDDLIIPESYQLNGGFERQLNKFLVFEANFTYNKTANLWRESNPNAPVLPAGTPDRNSDGQITFTDYLLGITTGPNLFVNGPTNDTVGSTPLNGSGACLATTAVCVVNVNTTNSNSSTSCATTGNTTNTPVCRAFAAINALRPFGSTLGNVQLERVSPIGNSRYYGAVFELRSRYRKHSSGFGGSARIVYTLSRLMDDGIVNTSDPTVPGDFSREWSRSLSDRTHRVSFSGTFDVPWYLGKLRFSPLFRFGSSAPFNLSAGGIDRSLDDLSNDRPSFAGDPSSINWRVYQSAFPQGIASQLSVAPIGSPGNLPRNAGNGPRLYIFDMSVTREFKIGERFRIRPNIEFNNILNSTVYSFGSNFINFDNVAACSTTNPGVSATCDGFLAPTRTVAPRRIRLGIRIDF